MMPLSDHCPRGYAVNKCGDHACRHCVTPQEAERREDQETIRALTAERDRLRAQLMKEHTTLALAVARVTRGILSLTEFHGIVAGVASGVGGAGEGVQP